MPAESDNMQVDTNNLRQLRLLVRTELNRLEDKHLALQTEGTLQNRIRTTTSVWELEHIIRDLLNLNFCSTPARKYRYRLAAYAVKQHGYAKLANMVPFVIQQVVQQIGLDNQQGSIAELTGLVKDLTAAAFQFHCNGNSLGAQDNWLSLMFLQPLIRPATKAPASTKASIAFSLAHAVLVTLEDWAHHEEVAAATRDALILALRHMPSGPRVPEGFLMLKQCVKLLGRRTDSHALKQVVKLCLEGMKSKDSWQIRRQAIDTLGSVAASLLFAGSDHVSSRKTCPAIEGLISEKEAILAALRDARSDANNPVRQQAAQTLSELQQLPLVPLQYQYVRGAEQEADMRASSRSLPTPKAATRSSPLQTLNRAVRSFLTPAALMKPRPAPSVPQYPFQRPDLSSTARQELDFGVQVFSLARPQPPIPMTSSHQELYGSQRLSRSQKPLEYPRTEEEASLPDTLSLVQDAIQPMAMYAHQPTDISPDVRPLEHGAHLLDKQVPNNDRDANTSIHHNLQPCSSQLQESRPAANLATESTSPSPANSEAVISPRLPPRRPLRQPRAPVPMPPHKAPRPAIPPADAAPRGREAGLVAMDSTQEISWTDDARVQASLAGKSGHTTGRDATAQPTRPASRISRALQASHQARQSGASVFSRQAGAPAPGGRQQLLQQSVASTIGSQGSCLDRLLQNPEALGADEAKLQQLHEFFCALSVRTSQALEAVADARPTSHRRSRLPLAPKFALKGSQPTHHVATGGMCRDCASPPGASSPGTSEHNDSLRSSRASSRPSSPKSIDAGILPLALQVFNCGIQDLCAPQQARSDYIPSSSSSPQGGMLPQRYNSPEELEDMPEDEQHPRDQYEEEEYTAARGPGRRAMDHRVHSARVAAGQLSKVRNEHEAASNSTSAADNAEAHSQSMANPDVERAQTATESQSFKQAPGVLQEPLAPLRMPQLMQEPDLQPEEAVSPIIMGKSAGMPGTHNAQVTAGQIREVAKEQVSNNNNISAANEAEAHTQPTASPGKKRAHAAPESQPAKRAAGGPQKPLPPLRVPQLRQEPDLQPPEGAESLANVDRSAGISIRHPVGVLESLNTFADKFLLSSRLDFRASTKAAEQEAWEYLNSSLPDNPIPRATSKARKAPMQYGTYQGPSKQQHGALPRRRASPLKPHAKPMPAAVGREAGPKGRASTDVHCNPLFDADSHRAANMLAVLRLMEPPPTVLLQPARSAGMHEHQRASNAGASLRRLAEEQLSSGTSSSMCDEVHSTGHRRHTSSTSALAATQPLAEPAAAGPSSMQPLWLDDHEGALARMAGKRKPERPSAFQRRLQQSMRTTPDLEAFLATAVEDPSNAAPIPQLAKVKEVASPKAKTNRKAGIRPGYSTLFDESSSESEDE